MNKSQHTKLTLEKKILPPLLPGSELATFRSRVRRSDQQANTAPGHQGKRGRKRAGSVCSPALQTIKRLNRECQRKLINLKRTRTAVSYTDCFSSLNYSDGNRMIFSHKCPPVVGRKEGVVYQDSARRRTRVQVLLMSLSQPFTTSLH